MRKPHIAWPAGINLILLLLLYAPLIPSGGTDFALLLNLVALNVVLIALNLVIALIVSIVPRLRQHAGAWWLATGVLLLASFPVCLATANLSGHPFGYVKESTP